MKNVIKILIAALVGTVSLNGADVIYSNASKDCFGFDAVLTYDIGGGYRQDNLKLTAFPTPPPNMPAEEFHLKWNNLEMGVVETNAQFLACDHYLVKMDFDFGWFTNENGHQTTKSIEIDTDILDQYLKSPTQGRVYDISGAIGYQFNWCCFRYALTPLLGYSYHYQNLTNRKFTNVLNPDQNPNLKTNARYRWRGATLGFTATAQVCPEWLWYFTYEFHWLRFRGVIDEWMNRDTPSETKLVVDQKCNGAHGNEFILGTMYQFCDDWFLGFKVDYKNFWGNKGSFTVETVLPHSVSPSQPFHNLRWNSLIITMDVGYIF